MEFRNFGGSGLRVPVLSLGAGTFGGKSEFFKAWGGNDVNASRRMIDLALEHIEKLERASQVIPIYPYWHQVGFAERNPFPAKLDYV